MYTQFPTFGTHNLFEERWQRILLSLGKTVFSSSRKTGISLSFTVKIIGADFPGNARSQGISSHGINQFRNTKWIYNFQLPMCIQCFFCAQGAQYALDNSHYHLQFFSHVSGTLPIFLHRYHGWGLPNTMSPFNYFPKF